MGRSRRIWVSENSRAVGLRPIAEAPRDGREILCTDGIFWRVCTPKEDTTDIWEFHRHIGTGGRIHSWSMAPTHFIPLEDLPQPNLGAMDVSRSIPINQASVLPR
jgi:hypothetical protein